MQPQIVKQTAALSSSWLHTIRCKEGALAGQGVADSADGLASLAQLASVPHRHTVVGGGCSKQLLIHRLHLHTQTACHKSKAVNVRERSLPAQPSQYHSNDYDYAHSHCTQHYTLGNSCSFTGSTCTTTPTMAALFVVAAQ